VLPWMGPHTSGYVHLRVFRSLLNYADSIMNGFNTAINLDTVAFALQFLQVPMLYWFVIVTER
jgi:hypothetical protein